MFLHVLTCIATIGGFLFGFDTGVIGGALLFIESEFGIENDEFLKSFVVSSAIAGCVIGSLLAGYTSDRFGRKKVIVVAGIAFFLGSLIMAAAQRLWVLLVGRVLIGVAIGSASMIVPIFIAEVAPLRTRGRLTSLFVLAITVGQFVAYVVDSVYASGDSKDNWRWMVGLGCVPAFLLTVGMLMMPESPRWLLLRGQRPLALAALTRIRSGDQTLAAAELDAIDAAIGTAARTPITIRQFLRQAMHSVSLRRALIVGCSLQMIQQVCGINTVVYYGPEILRTAGFSKENAIYASTGIAATNAVFTLVGVRFVDSKGRKPLALGSLFGCVLALVGLAAFGKNGWIAFAMLAAYIASFASGMGSIPWVVCAEIFPAHVRGVSNSIATATNWTSNFVVSQSFLLLASALGQSGVFLLIAAICIASAVYIYFCVPETKGLSFEEIEQIFAGSATSDADLKDDQTNSLLS